MLVALAITLRINLASSPPLASKGMQKDGWSNKIGLQNVHKMDEVWMRNESEEDEDARPSQPFHSLSPLLYSPLCVCVFCISVCCCSPLPSPLVFFFSFFPPTNEFQVCSLGWSQRRSVFAREMHNPGQRNQLKMQSWWHWFGAFSAHLGSCVFGVGNSTLFSRTAFN